MDLCILLRLGTAVAAKDSTALRTRGISVPISRVGSEESVAAAVTPDGHKKVSSSDKLMLPSRLMSICSMSLDTGRGGGGGRGREGQEGTGRDREVEGETGRVVGR